MRADQVLARLWNPRLARFAIVGLSGVVINLGALALFSEALGLEDTLSSAAAIEVSIIWNFLWNNAWTFRDKNANARAGFFGRLVSYNVVSLVGLLLQLGVFVIATRWVTWSLSLPEPGLWKYPAQLAGIGVAMAWNFLSNFHLTWATNPSAPPTRGIRTRAQSSAKEGVGAES